MRKPPLYKSFANAFRGIFDMLKSERNFQIEVFGLFINLILIYYLKLNDTDTAIILLCCTSIVAGEIFNTAIEKLCDIIQSNYDERIKFIKDISAGAVLLLTISAIIIGVVVYSNYL